MKVVNQLRINTKNSLKRYDVILLINGLPVCSSRVKDFGC
ncbi:MAG: type I restriction endonuclease [Coprobacter fastidiosus]